MKTFNKDNIFGILILVIMFTFFFIMGKECRNYSNELEFRSIYPVGSDSYMEDSLIWAHPDWSYERICKELYGREVK